MLNSFFKFFLMTFIFCMANKLLYANKPQEVHISNLPALEEHFTGRQEVLEKISNRFAQGDYIVTLVGFLGIGKTQIARKFATQNKENYDIVWFIDAKGSVVDQLRGLATLINEWENTAQGKKININAQPYNFLEQIHTFLKSTQRKWLLVLDNVQERGKILDFLPPKTAMSQGKILITTRNEIGWENPIRIHNFSRQESVALLKDILKIDQEDHLDKLAVLLFNHPLSLMQAGCYIRKHSHINTGYYMTLLTNRRRDLWAKEEAMIKEDKDMKDLHYNYQMTGSAALQLSFEELKDCSPLGLQLLYHSAFLHSTEIPVDILAEIAKALGYDPIFDYNEAIHQLTKISLLEKDKVASPNESDNSLFYMHDLTQAVLLAFQSSEEQKKAINTNLAVFSQVLSGGWDKVTKKLSTRPYLLAHIDSLCAHAKKLKLYNSSLIELMTHLLEYHMYHTREQAAYERLVLEIDALLKEAKDVSPLVLARFYSDRVYARSLSKEGEKKFNARVIRDYEKAIQILQDAPHQEEELFRVYMNFAQYYFLIGRFDDAKTYITKADEMVPHIKSESYKNLFFFVKAWMVCEMEEYELAHQSINEAINGLEKEENIALQIYIKNMKAWADLQTGDYEGAYRWAVQARQEALDFFDHKDTDSFVWSTLVIGVYKKRKGDLDGAEAAIKESLVRLEKEFEGALEVTDQAFAHTVLGDIYVEKGKLLEAKKEYQIAEKIYDRIYNQKEGVGISDLYVSCAILGVKLNDDFLAKHYLELHQKHYGKEHHGTKKILQFFEENNIDML